MASGEEREARTKAIVGGEEVRSRGGGREECDQGLCPALRRKGKAGLARSRTGELEPSGMALASQVGPSCPAPVLSVF